MKSLNIQDGNRNKSNRGRKQLKQMTFLSVIVILKDQPSVRTNAPPRLYMHPNASLSLFADAEQAFDVPSIVQKLEAGRQCAAAVGDRAEMSRKKKGACLRSGIAG